MTRDWVPYDTEFVSDIDRPELAVSPWAGHRWFAFDLFRWARPTKVVELGTHYGCSFFAFCQAALADMADCEITAIDTWEGDEHAGHYGEEVFEAFSSILERRFTQVNACVLRTNFDDAVDSVDDGSVDILHIDGLHTYEAVRHDYGTWIDKLATNGIVLFHDVAPSSGYGSARFWREISEGNPGFAFWHSFGLGVLLPRGTEGREALVSLGASPWLSYYGHRAGHQRRAIEVADLTEMVDERDAALVASEALVQEKDEAIALQSALIDERDAALVASEALVQEKDEAIALQSALIDERDAALVASEALVRDKDEAIALQSALIDERDAALVASEALVQDKDAALVASEALVQEKDEAIALQSALIDERDAALVASEALVRDKDAALVASEALVQEKDEAIALQSALIDERDAALVASEALVRDKDAALVASEALIDELSARSRRSVASSLKDAARRGVELVAPRAVRGARYVKHRWPRVVPGRMTAVMARNRERIPQRIRARLAQARGPVPLDIDPVNDREWIRDLFDEDFYLLAHPDVAQAGVDPTTHWLDHGWREGRRPCPMFDPGFYLESNPDVAALGVNPLRHYVEYGWREGRRPSAEFDPGFYLAAYPDVAAVDVNPLHHYLNAGAAEGRFPNAAVEEAMLGPREAAHGNAADSPQLLDARTGAELTPAQLPAADLITVDLWDTLLVRLRPPDCSKLTTAQFLLNEWGEEISAPYQSVWALSDLRRSIEAELARNASSGLGEYSFDDVHEILVNRAFVASGEVDSAKVIEAARAFEIADEASSVVPDLVLWDELLSRIDRGSRVVIASDFYHSAPVVREMADRAGLDLSGVDLFVSVDVGLSKLDGGRLLAHIRGGSIPASQHLHIGDSRVSDVEPQVAQGGEAAEVKRAGHGIPPGGADRHNVGQYLVDRLSAVDPYAVVRGVVPRGPQLERSHLRRADDARRAGASVAAIPVLLVARAMEEARRLGVDDVHYVSREGQLLARIHEQIGPSLFGADRYPRARHIAASRRSTFGPSLRGLDDSELFRLWRMYPSQSPAAFLVSLGADVAQFAAHAAEAELDVWAPIEMIFDDSRFRDFLGRSEGQLLETLRDRRELARRYFEGHLAHTEDLVIADLGWRGTIQDNIARVLPERRFHGVYLALFEYLNPQPQNSAKIALGPDANRGRDIAWLDPVSAIERVLTPPVASAVDYAFGAAGEVVAVEEPDATSHIGAFMLKAFQEGIAAAAPEVARILRLVGLPASELGDVADALLRSYLEYPLPGAADAYFLSAHDESFGVLNDAGIVPPTRSTPRLLARFAAGRGFPGPGEFGPQEWEQGLRAWFPVQVADIATGRSV